MGEFEKVDNEGLTLFEAWGRRIPKWEEHFAEELFMTYCNYRKGATESGTHRGKYFGGGYELYVVAFFIGLYSNKTKALGGKTGDFNLPLQDWGKVGGKTGARAGRREYTDLQKYMFLALLARTDVDFIALDKGEIGVKDVAKQLQSKMEEYANYGFHLISSKLKEDSGYFSSEGAFFDFMYHLNDKEEDSQEEIEPMPI